MTSPRLALAPRPDLPTKGEILTLGTPGGERFYRIARATAERVTLLPLSAEDATVALSLLRARAVQHGIAAFAEAVSAWAGMPRWRRWWIWWNRRQDARYPR